MTDHLSFHVTFSRTPADAPCRQDPAWVDIWPDGFWALYRINGDEIAQRIKFDANGKVSERWPWCGYIGGYGSLAEVTAAIAEIKTHAERDGIKQTIINRPKVTK